MNPDSLLERIAEQVLLLDGGMGSLLISMGLERGRAPEWWVIEHPQHIFTAHRAYVEAGSDVIHAATFGASPVKLTSVGLEGRCREINLAAVRLAREAGENGTLVAGDVGPTGLMLPPVGQGTEEQMFDAFEAQVDALAEGGIDLVSIETMYDVREAIAAIRAAKATGLPVLASMTFERRKRGFFTIMGNRLVESLEAMHNAGAHVVGFNCSVTADTMVEMVREARLALDTPLVAQPNAGQPRVGPDGITYPASVEDFVQCLVDMFHLGARVIGGCCGTTPAFICAVRKALDAVRTG